MRKLYILFADSIYVGTYTNAADLMQAVADEAGGYYNLDADDIEMDDNEEGSFILNKDLSDFTFKTMEY